MYKRQEYVRLTADGEEFWVKCDAHLEKDILSGDIIVLATVRNIDDRKSSELELKKQVVLDPLTKVCLLYTSHLGIPLPNQSAPAPTAGNLWGDEV